jgi:hypothetical protein
MGGFIVMSILFGLFCCIIPILLLFELYHWITKQNEVKYPFLKGTIFGLVIGLIVAFLITKDGSGESGMIAGGIAIILFPTSIVLGIFIGLYYHLIERTIFLKRKKHF